MKILTLMGSPRKSGSTAKVLGWVEDELRALGHDVQRVDIVDHEIPGWTEEMEQQQESREAGCRGDGDGREIFSRMIESDAIVFASPLYCWGFTAQLKALLDQSACLIKDHSDENPQSLLEGTRTALLVTAGGPEEDNADLIIKVYQRYSEYMKCLPVGHMVVQYCTGPESLLESTKADARSLATKIIGEED